MKRFIKNHKIVIFISIILFIIPFFWLKPNEMDLGGDSSRLYFYDPLAYMKASLLYVISPTGVGYIDSGVFSPLPQVALLSLLRTIFSPYILITLFNIVKVLLGFVFVYLITKELIRGKEKNFNTLSELASILAGLFYIFSRHMVSNYDKALLYHNQIFLNPLVFYLLLKYFLTKDVRYGWAFLFISFIFASNFSYLASPAFFAFYPLAIVFLLLYILVNKRSDLPWKGIVIGFFIFLGLHLFHIVPVLFDIFQKGSHTNTRLFDSNSINEQRSHFFGILQLASIQKTLLLPSWHERLRLLSVIYPFLICVGLILNKGRNKTILLTCLFFLLSFFLLTAKISYFGIEFYSSLFSIPGFSLFRNFTGIWTYVYSFFYALLLGQALFLIFRSIKPSFSKLLFSLIAFAIVIGAWPFIDGTMVNPVHYQSKNVKTAIAMDPEFEKTLSYVKSIPQDSKFLTLPFTDCCMQVLYGTNNAAYMGPSMIGYLAGKSDFTGYGISAPYSDLFFNLAKDKDYTSFKQMLGLLNVQYIFLNTDSRILENFPIYPFSPDYVRKYFPNSIKGYKDFVDGLGGKKIYENGPYRIYKLERQKFLPHFYVAKQIVLYENDLKRNQIFGKASSFLPLKNDSEETRIIFIDKEDCRKDPIEKICSLDTKVLNVVPTIEFHKINRTKYNIKVTNVKKPYVLVFSEKFDANWKLYDPSKTEEESMERIGSFMESVVRFFLPAQKKELSSSASYFSGEVTEGKHRELFLEPNTFEAWGKREVSKKGHIEVNGYANAWYITPEEFNGRGDYEVILELTTQRVIYTVLPFSLILFAIFVGWGAILLSNKFGIIGKFISRSDSSKYHGK